MDDMVVIHEYRRHEMTPGRIAELLGAGAKIYRICENPDCTLCQRYQPIRSTSDDLFHCDKCGLEIDRYGVEGG